MSTLRVLFAPDYRAGTPYQALLAEALNRQGVEVSFLSHYRRGLPLFRGSRGKAPNLLHLHWPERYYGHRADGWNWLRVMRYPLDYWLTANCVPIVVTAHNFLPHSRANQRGVFRNTRYTAQKSSGIFVHSDLARRKIIDRFAVPEERVHVIPFGDHSVPLGRPLPREAARNALGLPIDEKVCLVFGTVSPYKGTDELVRFWAQARLPYRLVIIGPILSESFADTLVTLAQDSPRIELRLTQEWLDEPTLRTWLSATDCIIFNYREVFSSGAAALTRSYGVPLLIPCRLATADLNEPHPHVFRFRALEDDFEAKLEGALVTPNDYDLAADWREETSWDRVAETTASVYRTVLTPSVSIAAGA